MDGKELDIERCTGRLQWQDVELEVELSGVEKDFSREFEQALETPHTPAMLAIAAVPVRATGGSVAQSMYREVEMCAYVVSVQRI